MRIDKIVKRSYVDGPGARAVLYMQGCPIQCPGCHSPHRHDPDGGQEMAVDEIAARLLDTGLPVTISGGEPFLQAEQVADLLTALTVQRPDLHIVVYSGMVLEDLLTIAGAIPDVLTVLSIANVLVDGPYIAALDHDRMQWRGSGNQRVIDLDNTVYLGDGGIVIGEPVLLDWETQVLAVTEDGSQIVGTEGMMAFLGLAGEPSRMCGEGS